MDSIEQLDSVKELLNQAERSLNKINVRDGQAKFLKEIDDIKAKNKLLNEKIREKQAELLTLILELAKETGFKGGCCGHIATLFYGISESKESFYYGSGQGKSLHCSAEQFLNADTLFSICFNSVCGNMVRSILQPLKEDAFASSSKVTEFIDALHQLENALAHKKNNKRAKATS